MLQHNKVMDIRSKPTFVPHGHHLFFAILPVSLFACWLAFLLLSHAMLAISILLVRLATLCFYPCIFLPLLVCWFSCLCLCMYTHGVRTQGVRALFPMRKQKRHGCKHVDISRAAIVSRFRSLAFSPLVIYFFKNPLPSSSLSPFDGLYQVYHAVYHSSSSLEYGDLCLFSYTYILGHALGMLAFTFLLCVLALCMMQVYIYLLAPFRCDCHDPCHLRLAMPNFYHESKVTSSRIFTVEIWHFAQMPYESIDEDHTLSKAKTSKSPCIQSPESQCQNHIFTVNL